MRNVLLASRWMAAALAIALFAATGDTRGDEPHSKDKGSGSGGARSSSGGGGGKIGGGGGKPEGGAKPEATKPEAGAKPEAAKPEAGAKPEAAKPDAGKLNKKGPGKAAWKSWTKDGWTKDGWNSKLNSQHKSHRHGYWNNGIWIVPVVISANRPWAYLPPPKSIASGQKWLGVTHEPYDGGGSYVTGVYEGSPAQAVGLEVGDVIVSLDGADATDLGKVIQASNGNVVLQVLSGRTGELVQSPVNLIR